MEVSLQLEKMAGSHCINTSRIVLIAVVIIVPFDGIRSTSTHSHVRHEHDDGDNERKRIHGIKNNDCEDRIIFTQLR